MKGDEGAWKPHLYLYLCMRDGETPSVIMPTDKDEEREETSVPRDVHYELYQR